MRSWRRRRQGRAPADPFFGVVSQQSHLAESDIERMGAGRVGTLRVALPWTEIDPTPVPGDYDWSHFDAIVGAAARSGIEVLPTAYTVPYWVSQLEGCDGPPGGPCAITPPHTELGLSAWRTFLAAGGPPLRAERRLLGPAPGPARAADHRLADLERGELARVLPAAARRRPLRPAVQAASEAIHGQDPDATVVLGGLFRYPLGGRKGGIRATDFLRELYAHPGIEQDFEGVAVHPYAARVHSVAKQVKRVVRVVREAGDQDAGIWITEVGWASGGKRNPLNRGPRGQAHRLRHAFGWFVSHRASLQIKTVLWYAWRDVPHGREPLQVVRAFGPLPRRLAGPKARLGRVRALHRRQLSRPVGSVDDREWLISLHSPSFSATRGAGPTSARGRHERYESSPGAGPTPSRHFAPYTALSAESAFWGRTERAYDATNVT